MELQALSFLAKLAHPEGSRDGPALWSRIRLTFSRPHCARFVHLRRILHMLHGPALS